MTINASTKIGTVIKDNPRAIETLIALSPHFSKLKNPILRKLLAPRVSIAEAARIGNCPVNRILDSLAQIGFEVNRAELPLEKAREELAVSDFDLVTSHDARADLEKGLDPLGSILKKLADVAPGKTMLVINSFEPVPLIRLLSEKGYVFSVSNQQPDLVFTYITRTSQSRALGPLSPALSENLELFDSILQHSDLEFIEMDVSAMAMPQPMIAILDKLEQLQSHQALYVHHKKIPVYLLPELKERNFKYVYKQNGSQVNILIYPASVNE